MVVVAARQLVRQLGYAPGQLSRLRSVARAAVPPARMLSASARVAVTAPLPLRLVQQPLLPRLAAAVSAGTVIGVILRGSQPVLAHAVAVTPSAKFAAPEELAPARQGAWAHAKHAVMCLARAVYLWLLFTPLLCLWPLAQFECFRDIWWDHCVSVTERSGALVVKLAQWASSRPDLFGVMTSERFKFLQDHTTPHAWSATLRTLDDSFGAGWAHDLRVEPTPIGSGCIAQVYRGSLRAGSGEDERWTPVAVKVIHPGVRHFIECDLAMLRAAGSLLQRLPRMRWLNPEGMIDEFASMLLRQLDLTIEARNLARFASNFPPENEFGVVFPAPVDGRCTRDVLVESFVEGEPLLRWAARQPEGSPRPKEVTDRGTDAVIKMIFEDNFVHGDLHPGNILVTPSMQAAAPTRRPRPPDRRAAAVRPPCDRRATAVQLPLCRRLAAAFQPRRDAGRSPFSTRASHSPTLSATTTTSWTFCRRSSATTASRVGG